MYTWWRMDCWIVDWIGINELEWSGEETNKTNRRNIEIIFFMFHVIAGVVDVVDGWSSARKWFLIRNFLSFLSLISLDNSLNPPLSIITHIFGIHHRLDSTRVELFSFYYFIFLHFSSLSQLSVYHKNIFLLTFNTKKKYTLTFRISRKKYFSSALTYIKSQTLCVCCWLLLKWFHFTWKFSRASNSHSKRHEMNESCFARSCHDWKY